MDDVKVSLVSFDNLSKDACKNLIEINIKIQAHKGAWGMLRGSEKEADGTIQMPYWERDSLISDFVKFMYDKKLVPDFDWGQWTKGREWYLQAGEDKFNSLDTEMALKLLTAVMRNDRFNDGALVHAFESGDFPKIINKLVDLKGAD